MPKDDPNKDDRVYMNGGLRRDVRDLRQEVSSVRTDVGETKGKCESIMTILQGQIESDEPGGLIHKVSKNSRFRKNGSKVIWFTFLLVLSLVLEKAFNIFGG